MRPPCPFCDPLRDSVSSCFFGQTGAVLPQKVAFETWSQAHVGSWTFMEQLPSCSAKSLIGLSGSTAATIPKFHKGPHEGPQELQSHSNSSSPVGYWLVLQQMGKQQVSMGKSRSFNHKCAIFKKYMWNYRKVFLLASVLSVSTCQLKCIAKLHRI